MKHMYALFFLCFLLVSHSSFSQSNVKYRDALNFDGYDDRVTIQPDAAFDFDEGTVEAWVQPQLLSGANMIVVGNRGADSTRYSIHMNANTIGLWNSSAYLTVQLTTPFRVGAWYHIAALIGKTSTKFYINGDYVGSTTNGMGKAKGRNIQIGNTYDILALKETFNGTIDEVKFWNQLRTESDIKSDMYDTASTNASLVAYYKLNEGSGNKATDATGKGRNGVLYNFALTGDRSNWVRNYTIGTPVATNASAILQNGFTANWQAPEGDTITSYILDVAADIYFTMPVAGYQQLNVGNVLSYNITGLNYLQKYYYRVRAVKEGISNPGPYSNTILVTTLPRPKKIFVNAGATSGFNNGKNWTNAFLRFDDALLAASYGDTIWVAKGTYQPKANKSFYLPGGVKIYGGFAGTETKMAERKLIGDNASVLSGNGSNVIIDMYLSDVELDGFTISGGYHNAKNDEPGDYVEFSGAGMYNFKSVITVRNCLFKNNICGSVTNPGHYSGGAVYNESSSLLFVNCVFEANHADEGGAIANTESSNTILTNCVFLNNSAANSGGAVFNYSHSQSSISGGIFYSNSTLSGMGSVVYNYSSASQLINCTITKNFNISAAGTDWLVANYYYSTGGFYNSIMVDNGSSEINYDNSKYYSSNNLTDFSLMGANNISGKAVFLDAMTPAGSDGLWGTSDDGLQLQAGSPAINEGDNQMISSDLTVDMLGTARIQNDTVDIGSYEYIGNVLPVTLASFKAVSDGCDVKINWKAAQETGVDKYTIEKSVDGIHFIALKETPAKNTSGASYSYTYNSSNESTLYFRLRITDRNGSVAYSSVERVSLGCRQPRITMTPNPVKNILMVSNLSGTSQVQVYNASGQQVVSVKTNSGQQTVNMASLPDGVYVVRVINDNKLVAAQKIMKY